MCTVIGILVTGSTSLDLLVSFNAAVSTIVCLPAVPAGNSKMYNASPRPSVAEGPTSLIFFKAMQLEGFRALAETHPQQAGQPKGVPGLQNPYEFFGLLVVVLSSQRLAGLGGGSFHNSSTVRLSLGV